MEIREACKKDVEKVFLLGSGNKEFSTENGSFWSQEQLRTWFSSEDDVTIVAEEGGVLIGFSLYATHKPTGKITWENLYIDPNARGIGVGKALILEGQRRLKEKGYSYIALQNNNEDKKKVCRIFRAFWFQTRRGGSLDGPDSLIFIGFFVHLRHA